jgi:N-acyl-D-aspartate/D-glutamate deacylase
LTAAADELIGIACALGALGAGVLQVISDFDDPAAEFAILRGMAQASGRPLSVSLMQSHVTPDTWRDILSRLEVANAEGLVMRAQVGARGIGVVLGLSCRLHPFAACPSFAPLRDLAPAEKARRMADPELRARVLGEAAAMPPGLLLRYESMFELADPPDYEPEPSTSMAARAAQQARPPAELVWDILRSGDGTALLYAPVMNYWAGNLDAVGEMLAHPNTVPGLSDGGAHVGTISDASFPTTLLAHWGRDRTRGRIDLPLLVARQCRATAEAVGLLDRGIVAPGYRADLNVVDQAAVRVRRPEMVADLPAGGHRLLQRADGYLHTFVAGTETFAGGQATGALPGRLIRGAQPGPGRA